MKPLKRDGWALVYPSGEWWRGQFLATKAIARQAAKDWNRVYQHQPSEQVRVAKIQIREVVGR